MKKTYIAPQTEAIKLLGENAIMAGSGNSGKGYIPMGNKVNGAGGY